MSDSDTMLQLHALRREALERQRSKKDAPPLPEGAFDVEAWQRFDFEKPIQGHYQRNYFLELIPAVKKTSFGWWTDLPYVNVTT